MSEYAPGRGDREQALRQALEAEMQRLAMVEEIRDPVAAVVRVRALADIAQHLDTDALVALSVAISKLRNEDPKLFPSPRRLQ